VDLPKGSPICPQLYEMPPGRYFCCRRPLEGLACAVCTNTFAGALVQTVFLTLVTLASLLVIEDSGDVLSMLSHWLTDLPSCSGLLSSFMLGKGLLVLLGV
jgi:hypothetical protein